MKEKVKGKLSKGQRYSVDPSLARSIRMDRNALDQLTILRKAWTKGKNPWITVDNPDGSNTKARFVKVRLNSIWGKYGEKKKKMIVSEESLDNPTENVV
jgi:hypothetical protein